LSSAGAPAHHLRVADRGAPDAAHRIKDRSEKLRKERLRMPVHGASLKNPDLQRVLLSGRRRRAKPR
jgi:hypothetical protein